MIKEEIKPWEVYVKQKPKKTVFIPDEIIIYMIQGC